jgi:hypothetical protein
MCVGRVMQEQLPRFSNRRIADHVTVATTQNSDKKRRLVIDFFP